jgi:hypothetical protein
MANNDYRVLLKKLLTGKTIAYHAVFADWSGGVTQAVMFSQLLHWSMVTNGEWFYKSVSEFWCETRLTKYMQQTARRDLISRGLIEAELRGVPPVWYYRVDLDKVIDILNQSAQQEHFPSEEVPPMELSSDGNCSNQKEHNPPNVGRKHLPSTGGRSARLNKVLHQTTSPDYQRIPPPESVVVDQDEGEIREEDTLEFKLKKLGVFDDCVEEIISSNLSDEQLWDLYERVMADDRIHNKAAILVHRFNRMAGKVQR